MKYTLFPDQKIWCRATVDALTRGADGQPAFDRVLSVAATGAGKTIMSSALAEWSCKTGQGKTLFLADSDELVNQAIDKIFKSTGMIAGKEKASSHASRTRDVVVGSIQTLAQQHRLETWDPAHFGLVIADEAHLSMSDSWQRVLKHFTPAKQVGVTATPERADERDLWNYWQHEAANISLFELIDLGRLSPIRVQTCPIDLNCRGIKASGQGLNEEELSHRIEPAFDAIIEAWKRYGEGRKTLWFLPGVAASKVFAEKLRRAGLTAKHVDGASKDRQQILKGYEDGEFEHLTNAQLLMKGYDCPDIGAVVILRPTKSRVAYQQMVGRGTRVCDRYTDMLLLDFLWDFDKLMVRPADLIAKNKQQADAIQRRFAGTDEQLDIREAAELAHIDAVKKLIDRLTTGDKRTARTYTAHQAAALMGEQGLLDYEPRAGWEIEKPSQKQLDVLKAEGIQSRTVKTKGEASQLIGRIGRRKGHGQADIQQLLELHRLGAENPLEFTKDAAGRAIAANI